eukprot:m.367153 g.367153  ORF g.367153 m.367153 type:complete len:148 (+) comp20824_c0_seq2:157-600(+)
MEAPGALFPPLRAMDVGGSAAASVKAPTGPHGVNDTLREGLKFAKDSVRPKHPVERAQDAYIQHQEEMNMAIAGSVVNRSLPTMVRNERAALAQMRRLPVLHSSMVALEISLGRESTLDFEDYLNDPSVPEQIGDVHTMTDASPFFK